MALSSQASLNARLVFGSLINLRSVFPARTRYHLTLWSDLVVISNRNIGLLYLQFHVHMFGIQVQIMKSRGKYLPSSDTGKINRR